MNTNPSKIEHSVTSFDAVERRTCERAFSLIEMLVVLGIIGILAGLTLPKLSNIGKGNLVGVATRQLMDDMMYARLEAMSSRNNVYVGFMVTPEYLVNARLWDYSAGRMAPDVNTIGGGAAFRSHFTNTFENTLACNKLMGAQLTGYIIFSESQAGAQPGEETPRLLTDWQYFPEGVHIPLSVLLNSNLFLNSSRIAITDANELNVKREVQTHRIQDASVTIPFPGARTNFSFYLPAIGFNSNGRLIASNADNVSANLRIPIFQGSVFNARLGDSDTNMVLDADAVLTAPPVLSGELLTAPDTRIYYVVTAPGSGSSDTITYNSSIYRPGDVFEAIHPLTNYTAAGQAQVVLFSGIEINRLTGRSKVLRAR